MQRPYKRFIQEKNAITEKPLVAYTPHPLPYTLSHFFALKIKALTSSLKKRDRKGL